MSVKINFHRCSYLKLQFILIVLVGIFHSCTLNATETTICDLTVNYAEDPIGIEPSGIVFGWKMDSKTIGLSQEFYQIVVLNESGNKIWDSGEVSSDLSVAIPYSGPELDFETQYYWDVTVGCSNGELAKSERAYYETGTDFSGADWIYYEPMVENCFNEEYRIDVTPTIEEDGFTLYFGVKNEENRFVWSFSGNNLTATKVTPAGTIELGTVSLGGIVSEGTAFELSISVTDNTITTSINDKEVSVIEHSFSIEKPYVSLMAAAAQTDRRSGTVLNPAQSATFNDFTISIDGKSEKVDNSTIRLTVPETQQGMGGFPGMRGAPSGEIYNQKTFNGQPVVYEEESTAMPLFRTEQTIKSNVESARLYISSLGVFDAYINGKEVMQLQNDGTVLDDIFSPGWTNYNDYIYFRTYDVTNYIDGNEVALGARIGNGWYSGIIGEDYYGRIGDDDKYELALIAKMVINYTDGSQDVILTNTDDWTASEDGPILMNDFFMGEIYDARLEANVKGWNDVNFNDSNWNAVTKLEGYSPQFVGGDENTAYMLDELRLDPQPSEDTFIYDPENIDFSTGLAYGQVVPEIVNPQNEIKLEKGEKLIIDFGQNIAGVTGISLSGTTGTMVRMQGAEMLNDGKTNPNNEGSGYGSCGPKGTIYLTGLTRAREDENDWYTDVYYLNDEEVQDYRASFTFHGYRYLEISTDNDITIHDIYAQPMTSVTEQTGSIITNNEDVNKLHQNTLWSQMGNHITIPTDCPNRSERLGWSGDIVVFAETALYNFDAFNFMNNYMDIAVNYNDNNAGKFGTTMPGQSMGNNPSTGGFGGGSTNAGWTDVGITLTWALYLQTGDISVLEENYDMLSAYMDGIMAEGLRAGFGDWVALQTTSGDLMAGYYQAYDAMIMAKMAEAVGKKLDAEKYQAEYERMRDFLAEKYVDDQSNVLAVTADNVTGGGFMGTGIIQDNSQTSIIWALKMGLYNSEEEKETFIKNLLTNIDNVDESVRKGQGEKTLSTGFLGVNVLLPVLTENSLSNAAYDLLLQDAQPSWLYEVNQGATTTWERWNAYSHVNSFEDNGMNSFNHYAYGAVAEWMFEYMAGIQKDENNPGFKNVILQPTIDTGSQFNDQERITEVDGEYESYYGKIVSSWTSNEGNLKTYKTVIPSNTTATLYLPINGILIDDFDSISGVTFVGLTDRNGNDVAKFELASGGYLFEADNGSLSVKIIDGYTTD